MTKTRLLIKNACYHIYSRGNQKQNIFTVEDDYDFYIKQLRHYKRKFSFLLYGYCLMSNHVHLIGETMEPKNLPRFMQSLQRSYTAYFNKNYSKVGHLWQGRFKMKVITKDQYLIDCIAYIEQNPIRAKLETQPGEYKFSSYQERSFGDKGYGLLDELIL